MTRFFAKAGQEVAYMFGLLHTPRQAACFNVYEAGSFSAVALVRDTAGE